nr:RNA/RNP complex-1-interacting phosphatase homolog isoform X2 [Ciona intestinalis]XP_026693213.1 RNA/RNP complex-1-interacting phosphatase homolog isoform X2 [Ciona intestinalis]XP_026693214.1 RNA/RNP complex-1-interacting phosphatase homolog isoform X2 [Ciona intestinalis]|eukprot:XP_026693212.1 RNA/RNP complex-1-interacting phosphatase homolog isoform X2 [Ciona intestinalis]
MPRIPDRWLDYEKMGQVIEGTDILAMKVPLYEGITRNLPKKEHFNWKIAVDTAEERGHRIGTVVDLTYSTRYYQPRDFTNNGISHHKIFVPGQIIPPPKVVSDFTSIMSKFEKNKQSDNEVIAVHCTHGLNRTGYLICRYLIEEKKFKPKDAIEKFNSARGHKIERENYLKDLISLEKEKPVKTEQSPQKTKDNPPKPNNNSQKPKVSKTTDEVDLKLKHQNKLKHKLRKPDRDGYFRHNERQQNYYHHQPYPQQYKQQWYPDYHQERFNQYNHQGHNRGESWRKEPFNAFHKSFQQAPHYSHPHESGYNRGESRRKGPFNAFQESFQQAQHHYPPNRQWSNYSNWNREYTDY